LTLTDSLLSLPLIAAEVSTGPRSFVSYELQRLAEWDDPRLVWAVLALLSAVAVVGVGWVYRRESAQLPAWLRVVLPLLRLSALAGMGLFFLQLEKRVDQEVVTDSRVLVAVDTSQSMAIQDEAWDTETGLRRADAVALALSKTSLFATLLEQHDVEVALFDKQLHRLARWPRQTEADQQPDRPVDQSAETTSASRDTPQAVQWQTELSPRGGETRLGDALGAILDKPSAAPLAGVVVISDGRQNSGVDPLAMADLAQRANVPLYVVGVGSTQPRRNLRVQDLLAPARVYPEDKTTIRAMIHGEGYAGRTVNVELLASDARAGNLSPAQRVGSVRVTFDAASQVVPVSFDIEPAEIGTLSLEVRIDAPADDQYAADNRRTTEMEVVQSQTRVLLIAGGATRDYRFLRNHIRRDQYASVDVWLQGAEPGISQDADNILFGFPTSKDELYQYDCLVAFDPDWTLLDAQQVEMLQQWVADEAGGLIVVAGPIHMASWIQSPEHAQIRALYPVEFQRRLTLLDDGLYGSQTAWPIEFSADGQAADYLWLADTPEVSRSLWEQFAGVFGCYAVKGPKPGARVLGRYSDPDAGLSADRPVYLAEHFYGAGRVLYMGSGELWRLRSMDISLFEIVYTQLIRHVSQGRLLRSSSRGHLLVERDRYLLGDTVVVRARLTTASREPLLADRAVAQVVGPDGSSRSLPLVADPNRPGNFVGQLSVVAEGDYRILLPVPDAPDEQLVRRFRVAIPNLEFESTGRDQQLLAALAKRSGGKYYTSLTAAVKGSPQLNPVAKIIRSRAETKIDRGAPDREFALRLNQGLLALVCGALSLEWLLRRLMRLA